MTPSVFACILSHFSGKMSISSISASRGHSKYSIERTHAARDSAGRRPAIFTSFALLVAIAVLCSAAPYQLIRPT